MASLSQLAQWVVTRLPSRSPASASRNVPVHTDASRWTRGAIRRSQSISARSPKAASTPRPPATISVSKPSRTLLNERAETSSMPEKSGPRRRGVQAARPRRRRALAGPRR